MSAPIENLNVAVSAESPNLAADLNKIASQFRAISKRIENDSPMSPASAPKPLIDRSLVNNAKSLRDVGDKARDSRVEMLAFAAGGVIASAAMKAMHVMAEEASSGFNLFADSVKLAAGLEQTTIAFGVMLNSGEKAATMIEDIRQIAATSPFQKLDVTIAAKELIAYGLQVGDVKETLRMLGDVAAGAGVPLQDMAYLYGKIVTSGKLNSRELMEFSTRGVPLLESLEKITGKTGLAFRDMVEEGRVGFPQVTQGLVGMTSAGGRFYNLSKKQMDSLAGTWTNLQDAFSVAKVHLGNILIDELGLKDATKDLTAFTSRIDTQLDAIRPGVRFIGDLAKGFVQIGYEVQRAQFAIADFNGQVLAATFPEFGKALEGIGSFVKDISNWKIDDRRIINFAANLSTVVIGYASIMADGAVKIGEGIDSGIIQPLKKVGDTIDSLMGKWNQIEAMGSGLKVVANAMIPTMPTFDQVKNFAMNPSGAVAGAIAPPSVPRKPDPWYIQGMPGGGSPEQRAQLRQDAAMSPAEVKAMQAGSPSQQLKSYFASAMGAIAETRVKLLQGLDIREQAEAKAAMAANIAADKIQAFGAIVGLGAIKASEFARAAEEEAKARQALVHLTRLSPEESELAAHLNKEFADPGEKLKKDLEDIHELWRQGDISDSIANHASDFALHDAANKAGIGNQQHGAGDAALVGTTADTKILSQMMGGINQGSGDPARLLQLILEQLRDSDRALEKIYEGFNRDDRDVVFAP